MASSENDENGDLHTGGGWRETDPEKPVRRLFVADAESQGSVNRHPSAAKPKKQLTGRIALIVADKRERAERYDSQLGTGANLRGVSREKLDTQAQSAHEAHEQGLKLNGHVPVTTQLELDFVPEQPTVDEVAASEEPAVTDHARLALHKAHAKTVIKLPPRPRPVDPSELPPFPPAG